MMNEVERAQLEDDARALCEQGDHDTAASRVIRAYGGEIFGFLLAVQGDEVLASDAFSVFAERLWRGLPGFEWASTLRTWAYAIARNAARTAQRDAARRERHVARVPSAAFEEIAVAVRTQTLAFLRSENRSRLEALRASLPPEDRALLILRLDRGLAWAEVARVLAEGDEPMDEACVAREAARLRKRYQLVKDQLRATARAEGLLD